MKTSKLMGGGREGIIWPRSTSLLGLGPAPLGKTPGAQKCPSALALTVVLVSNNT
jgi:hypothetical protein